jgi:ADP-ribose pyrophosphatase YjhB (NUDIX family)
MHRAVIASLLLVSTVEAATSPDVATRLAEARTQARQITTVLAGAFASPPAPVTPGRLGRESLAGRLALYAALPVGAPDRHETMIEAARRILAGGTTTKRTPEQTLFQLDDLADTIFAAVDAVEVAARASGGAADARELTDLRTSGHIARFHARRIVAAMHYNLFLRGQRLAELVAATYAEKDVVEAWRQLTTLPASPEITAARLAELKKLEASFKDLEDQCCPPDEAIMREKVWKPVRPAPTLKANP